ncbi:MAG: hypothetical protein NC213_04390 [Acetobacter sp.]|nr:hypothetical protein [Bacteroides sp.]MCM1340963.1 hypothetical protein [Acetobacter sp.]MCM1432481.1 hypothetical protein [Clostridiales bacterium]
MKRKLKSILILTAELALCTFAISNCIFSWTDENNSSSIGTDIISFIGYILLAILFIIIFVKDNKKTDE